jgi:hypothetical protein
VRRLRLPIVEVTAPPATRGDCSAIARPCPRYLCRHNLSVEDERAGRPHHGVSPPPVIVVKSESCALDVAERGGLSYRALGAVLAITRQRAEQVAARAARKLQAHAALSAAVEALELPRGCRARATAIRGGGTGRALARVVLSFASDVRELARDEAAVAVAQALCSVAVEGVEVSCEVVVPDGAQPVVFLVVFRVPDVGQ